MSKPKPYAEIRDWTNVGQVDLLIDLPGGNGKRVTVAPGKTFKGEAPRLLIRSGALRPTSKKPKAAKK